MPTEPMQTGLEELRHVRRRSRPLYRVVALFSFFANLLLLAGPLYMLQVYDRVLNAGSVETLVALSLLVAFLYIIMGVLDGCRNRIMTRIAFRFEQDLESRVFDASLRKAAVLPDAGSAAALSHLSAIRHLLCSPFMTALMDLPWTPLFLGVIFVFHPVLGALALGGMLFLIVLTFAGQHLMRRAQDKADETTRTANRFAHHLREEAALVQALSMRDGAYHRWHSLRQSAQVNDLSAADTSALFAALTRMLRLMLQSAILGLGAWLVLGGDMTPGGMVAAAILLGRAVSPVEAMLAQWPLAQRGMQGWYGLAGLLGEVADPPAQTGLPKPKARLELGTVTVMPPGERRAVLKGINFTLAPGQAMGVIGPSGAGKSSLGRVLTGAWPLTAGTARLDGAALSQYTGGTTGPLVGYMPQQATLFDGTIAQNIARFRVDYDSSDVISAARMAVAHDLILSLPEGYDTVIRDGQHRLSAGQVQRIALARALFGDPVIVVLDEPNANLDSEGTDALNAAIRQLKARGACVVVMAHRPAAIRECDTLLMLEAGLQNSFGPRDEVLGAVVRNAHHFQDAPARLGHVI
jgi:ATP-binding cassette subfamily C protein